MGRLIILLFGFMIFIDGMSGYTSDTTCPNEPVVRGVADLRCWDGHSKLLLVNEHLTLTPYWHLKVTHQIHC
jgi:hypothetical protein